jgi:hypothetical protein
VEAIVGIPYQAAYGAAKHGMKAYLDVLRIELDHEDAPVSVTNIMPSGINTPFFTNARTKLGVKPMAVPPMYQPEIVASAIVVAAAKPIPEIMIRRRRAGFSRFPSASRRTGLTCFAPDFFNVQKTDEPKGADAPTNLFNSDTRDTRVRGDFPASRNTSLVTWLETHPSIRTLLGYGVVLGALGLIVRKK